MRSAKNRFELVEALFCEAGALPIDQRESFLRARCANDPSVCEQVLSMLRVDHRTQNGVLDRPALGEGFNLSSLPVEPPPASSSAPLPERIGHYRIVRVIGEGGMGVVHEAEQENPRRRVALKLLRPGAAFGSRHRLQRFRQEAQILGRLQHQGIAQILEAGTTDFGEGEQPYFVMEFVNGKPLLEHAREKGLSVRQRLNLIALICDAVHYAHQNGVIHRDLKPGNILVVEDASNGSGVRADGGRLSQPKILDFGVARLTDADVQALTLHTTVGELIGTVPYMSPEQAAGDPAALDGRSDVYALGVILFELLTDRLPQEVRHLMVHEAVRVIREDDPTPAGSVVRSLRGDVETIIAKALEKDKARRYQSAAELAADLRRHLSEQPIAARRASALYRMRKFARRNKAIVTGVAFAFAAMMLATAFSVRQAVLTERARSEEHRLRGVADQRTAEALRETYRASMLAASSALRYHETADAQRHLAAAPPHLRGWEWDHLSSRVDDSLFQADVGFTPLVLALAPDGRTVATASSAGLIECWRMPHAGEVAMEADDRVRRADSDAKPLKIASYRLQGSVKQRRVTSLAFSTDGRELRAHTWGGSALLSLDSMMLIDHDDAPIRLRSPDGQLGVVGIEGNQMHGLRLIEVAGGRLRLSVAEHTIGDDIVRFSADGALVALGLGDKGGLAMYRTVDGVRLCQRSDFGDVADVSFSSGGRLAAVASLTGSAWIIETATGADQAALRGHGAAVTAIAFSPDDARIATSSSDGTVRLWRAADGAALSVMHGNTSGVVDLAFSADGSTFVTACADGEIRWWDATVTSDPFVLRTPGTVYAVAFSPDGGQVVAACLSGEGPLRVWDAATGLEQFAASDGALSALAISPDGTRFALGRSGTVSTLIVDNENLDNRPDNQRDIAGHWWRTDWVAFRDGGRELLSLGNGGRLVANDIATGAQVQIRNFPSETIGAGCRAAISPDQSLMAVASGSVIYLLDSKTWDVLGTLTSPAGNTYALAFSPDGARLASGGSDGTMRVWNLQRQQMEASLAGHSAAIYAIAFSPDGERVVSAGRDHVIRIRDAATLAPITQLHGHSSLVYCLAFSPDGRMLASGGGDDTVRLWSTVPLRAQWHKRSSDRVSER